jgi:hypothetical protein
MTIKSDSLDHITPFNYNNPEPSPLLPRSGWNNQIAYLRILFKTKKRLDEIEQNFQNRTEPND